MSKIFITRQIPEIGINILREKGYDVTIGENKTPPTEEELINEIKDKNYDVVVTLLTDKINNKVFDASPSTKLFANYAIGYDNIDVEEATRRGVYVTNTPGDYVGGIAEHTIGLILALMAKLVPADTFVRQGKYSGWDPMIFIGDKLEGKTVAIIGTGRIGEQVARKLYGGFGVKIVYFDTKRNEKIEKECNALFVDSIDETLSISDVISIHVPLLDSTHHLINKDNLKKMKPSAYLINTSRGAVIDEVALVEALKSGQIRGAALDVYEFEPKLASGLIELQNTILSPHIASAQTESREDMSMIMAQNVVDYIEGRIPRNKVNK